MVSNFIGESEMEDLWFDHMYLQINNSEMFEYDDLLVLTELMMLNHEVKILSLEVRSLV